MTRHLIVAMEPNYGIGYNNKIPWRIKEDLKLFKAITTSVQKYDSKNIVVMGRKTWDSIPEKYKPLPNRINVVLSTTMTLSKEFTDKYPDTFVFSDFENMEKFLENKFLLDYENIFFIGGKSIYEYALNTHCDFVHISHVKKIYKTDVQFPFETVMSNYHRNTIKPFDKFTYCVYTPKAVDC